MRWLAAVTLCAMLATTSAASGSCYSCSGTCHSETCNCQMGSCKADRCFIEKKPTDIPGISRITKGCIANPTRTSYGCDMDHFTDHVSCVCAGNFCNDHIYARSIMLRRNVTCRKCSERDPDCSQTCQGHWCHEDSTTGASGCGYGPPSLPFFHKGPELFFTRSKVCVTMSRGAGLPRRHCICNTSYCNHARHSHRHAHLPPAHPDLKLVTCFNCDVNTQDSAITASCKQNRCTGHFCTYARHQHILPNEKQGCMNVTDSNQIQLGCSKKWMEGEFAEESCACNDHNLCNRDHITAGAKHFAAICLLVICQWLLL